MSMQIPTGYGRSAPDTRAYDTRPTRTAAAERPQAAAETAKAADLDIKRAMVNLERQITQFNRRFQFVVDEHINRIVIKVIDKDTDKLIKEIPPEEIQHLIARLRETMGLLVDEEI
jgi:flagellar protein FlaG